MRKSLSALALGAFALGAAEFVMMGVLPRAAADMHVDIPTAGHFISAYAIGVCLGTLILVFGRTVPPKRLILGLLALIVLGNLMAAVAPDYPTLVAARLVSGLPHGAFFGMASVVAKRLATPGREAAAVSAVLTGQTIANMVGVPVGTLLGETLSWRVAFAVLALWAFATIIITIAWVPDLAAIHDAGLAGQFRFLSTPRPWLVAGAVFLGSSGLFSWWSYVSGWLTSVGGYAPSATPALMALAGLGMVMGGLAGGATSDRITPGKASALGQFLAVCSLVLVGLDPGSWVTTALLTILCAFAMFFANSPQQLVMVQIGEGGGELVAAAMVQVGFNLGNSLGAVVGGIALTSSSMDYHMTAFAGAPFSLAAVILLTAYSVAYEKRR
jgi:DHA1 family arabinose polymer transporter-like MFS transporter